MGLSALVIRKKNDLQAVTTLAEMRRETGRPPLTHIHWRTLNHKHKVYYSALIASLPIRVITVCVHKPSIREVRTFQQKNRLYFYGARYLLERISWLTRDHCTPGEGNGRAELLFSARKHLSYTDLCSYLELLKDQQGAGDDIRIEFGSLSLERKKVRALRPSKSAGLQLVDACAGAVFNALERDKFGNTEPRYAKNLLKVMYQHTGSVCAYGMKVMPPEADRVLSSQIADGTIEPIWQ